VFRLLGVAAISLVLAGPASAYMVCSGPQVVVGPEPQSLTITSGDTINWTVIGPPRASRITFPDAPCAVMFGARSDAAMTVAGCSFFLPGVYSYSIAGYGAGSGTVTVLPPSLKAVPNTVVFGESTVLSGQLPSRPDCSGGGGIGPEPQPPDKEGTVFARSYGAPGFSPLSAVTAMGARGDFALLVTPSIGTAFEARLDSLTTITATVRVQPRIELSRSPSGRFLARAFAVRSLGGARVHLQVRRANSRWRSVRSLGLDPSGTVRFWYRDGGRQLRIAMSAQQAGPGYVAGFSPALSL
jgi:hypothetical protein